MLSNPETSSSRNLNQRHHLQSKITVGRTHQHHASVPENIVVDACDNLTGCDRYTPGMYANTSEFASQPEEAGNQTGSVESFN